MEKIEKLPRDIDAILDAFERVSVRNGNDPTSKSSWKNCNGSHLLRTQSG